MNSWVAYMIMVNDCFAKDPDVYEKINRRELTFSEADAIRSSLDKFQQLVDNGILNMDHLGLAYGDAMTVFAQGKAAMVPDGSFAVPAIMAANPDIKLGSFSIPGDNGESTVWGSLGMTYSVNKNISDEKKAAAKEFLSFMLDKTVSKEFSEATALFTTLSDVELQYEDPVINDFAKMATGDMFIIPSLDSSVVDATWGNVFWDGLQGIVAGTETTQSILEDLDGKVIE